MPPKEPMNINNACHCREPPANRVYERSAHPMANSTNDFIRIWSPEGIHGLKLLDARVQELRWPKHFNAA
jgi:hypothetical protein